MVAFETTKRVLRALADTLPGEGGAPSTRVEVLDGWGDVVLVRIHARESAAPDARELVVAIRSAIEEALGAIRHRVEIAWDSAG